MKTKPIPQWSFFAPHISFDPTSGSFTWLSRRCKSAQWNGRYAGKPAGSVKLYNGKPYARLVVDYEEYLAHRLVASFMGWEIPPGHTIDHINGDGTDNRPQKLRVVSWAENSHNMKLSKRNKSGYCGVFKVGRRWRAYGMHNGKTETIGWYDSAERAAEARAIWNGANGFSSRHGT